MADRMMGLDAFSSYRDEDDDDRDVDSLSGSDLSPIGASRRGDQSSKSTDSEGELEATEEVIAKRETQAYLRSKIMVYLFLIGAGAACAAITYFFMLKQEQISYADEFEEHNTLIFNGVDRKVETAILALHTFSQTLSSSRTLLDFEERVQAYQQLASAELLAHAPLLPKRADTMDDWHVYAQTNAAGWIAEGRSFWGLESGGDNKSLTVPPFIHSFLDNEDDNESENTTYDWVAPLWQLSPLPLDPLDSPINLDLFSLVPEALEAVVRGQSRSILTPPLSSDRLAALKLYLHPTTTTASTTTTGEEEDDSVLHVLPENESNSPRSLLVEPILGEEGNVTGVTLALISWDALWSGLLESEATGLAVQLENTCSNENWFFQANDEGQLLQLIPKVSEDTATTAAMEWEDSPYESKRDFIRSTLRDNGADDYCGFKIHTHVTEEFVEAFQSNNKWIYPIIVGGIFLFTGLIFVMYDLMVKRRQTKVLATAKRSNAIVSSLFPKEIQKRMMEEAEANGGQVDRNKHNQTSNPSHGIRAFAAQDALGASSGKPSAPIADFFPAVTIMFGDIVGFTSWSSARQPAQVFILLETIYHAFDEIAEVRRVFKVETVGDCYVAASGLPEMRRDHAIVMARFARDCLFKFTALVKELETELGPGTGKLGMRFGLHSGSVTAGVLRGQRARFQLFGDSVNTASRIETTGMKGKIHMSHQTAEQLIARGKHAWVKKREDKVLAKGLGQLETFWLQISNASTTDSTRSHSKDSDDGSDDNEVDVAIVVMGEEQKDRIVGWVTELMVSLLKEVVAQRGGQQGIVPAEEKIIQELEKRYGSQPLNMKEENVNILNIPLASEVVSSYMLAEEVTIDPRVVGQLRDFVAAIADAYPSNPFHNFEHASHVTMSVSKLLSRIQSSGMTFKSEDMSEDMTSEFVNDDMQALHDHTYGITSDPLTQFAVVLSALIHDVDHPGVPNSTLTKENNPLSDLYKAQSVAEKHSIDMAWKLLLSPDFLELRGVLYTNERQFRRFRQVLVNMVLATDIMDKELGQQRKQRWNAAFETDRPEQPESIDVKRKATIVLEHLIQASDVAHTMQHWHIYRKWNTSFFREQYKAFKEGRAETDPSIGWYQGELGFFDFYIIPLAKKLKECGVFGVSSDEYLMYAQMNRSEWERKGEDIVKEMVKAVEPRKQSS